MVPDIEGRSIEDKFDELEGFYRNRVQAILREASALRLTG